MPFGCSDGLVCTTPTRNLTASSKTSTTRISSSISSTTTFPPKTASSSCSTRCCGTKRPPGRSPYDRQIVSSNPVRSYLFRAHLFSSPARCYDHSLLPNPCVSSSIQIDLVSENIPRYCVQLTIPIMQMKRRKYRTAC